jgi:hypothetical protein
MRINEKLKLVIPLGRPDSADNEGNDTGLLAAVVHTTPISSDVFDTYFLPLSRTYAAIHALGLGAVAGPRVADKLLRKVSKDMGAWEGEEGVERGLIAEIHRLTMVAAPSEKGWQDYQYQEAKDLGIIDADDAPEVDAAIVFFTVYSCMTRKRDLKIELGGGMKLWGARLEYSTFTELVASLRTSTVTANSGGKAEA